MHIFPNSDSTKESGKKPADKAGKKASAQTGIAAGKDSTGSVNDVLTRLNNTLVRALSQGVTKVDGKELDHGQAEELRKMMGLGYTVTPTSVESLSHVSKDSGDEVWSKGWMSDTSSRVTLSVADQSGQPMGSYGLTLSVGAGKTAKKPTKPQKKAAAKETNAASSFGFLMRSGFSVGRKKRPS